MSVNKRKYKSGEIVWSYLFSGPGATRQDRRQCTKSGFATKKEAENAEAVRRIAEQERYELEKTGCPVVAVALPKTLSTLMEGFFKEYAEEKLAPKTVERYRESVAYLAPPLLAMPLADITPLHLNREWNRLLKSGGHFRRTKEPRPLSDKTVRNIAGVVSSAFGRAIIWGLVTVNPVAHSEPPVPKKRRKVALTTGQQDLLVHAASGPWCLGMYLEMDAATGARRGEVLAVRWADLLDGRVVICRSLCQTKSGLVFKCTKEDDIRVLGLPAETLAALEVHRSRQAEFRRQFGADYRSDLDLIFANPDGSPLRPDSISASVSALFKRLKIQKPKGAALHLLRHSHGSHMLANHVPLPVVSARLGHASVRTTADIYSHAMHGQDDEAVKRWEEYQKQNRPTMPETGKAEVQ